MYVAGCFALVLAGLMISARSICCQLVAIAISYAALALHRSVIVVELDLLSLARY